MPFPSVLSVEDRERPLTRLEIGLFFAVMLAVIAFIIVFARWRNAVDRERSAGLARDRAEAMADTSRNLALSARDSAKLLGDSLDAQTRRVVQQPQKNDALDKAIGGQRAMLDSLTVQVRALSAKLASSSGVKTDAATGERSATFNVRPDSTAPDAPPYAGTATATLPVSGPGTLDLRLSLPSAPLALRVNCGAAINGIRPAVATVTGPRWLDLKIGAVQQDDGVCNPVEDRRPWWKKLASKCGLDAGFGAVLEVSAIHVGPAAVAGCKLFP